MSSDISRRLAAVTAVDAATGAVTLDLSDADGIPVLASAGPLAVGDAVLVDLYAHSAVILGKPGVVPVSAARTRVTSGSQTTTSGAEVMWAALHTAVFLVAGRRYQITVTVGLDAGAGAVSPARLRARNSGSASNPTTSSTLLAGFTAATGTGIVDHRTWIDEFVAAATGPSVVGVSVGRVFGTTPEVTVSAAPQAMLRINDAP